MFTYDAATLNTIAQGGYGPLSDWELWVGSECGRSWPVDAVITTLEQRLQHVALEPAPSHTFIVLLNRRLGLCIGFEAAFPRLRVFDPCEKLGRTIRYCRVPLGDAQLAGICRRAAARIGRGYDVFGLWLVCVALMVGHPGWLYVKRAQLYCTAWVVFLLRSVGVEVLAGVHADNATPALWEAGMLRLGWTWTSTPPFLEMMPSTALPTADLYHSPL